MHATLDILTGDYMRDASSTKVYVLITQLLIHDKHGLGNQVLLKLLIVLDISFGFMHKLDPLTSGASSRPTLCSTKELKIPR
jgi:hypothetical protein